MSNDWQPFGTHPKNRVPIEMCGWSGYVEPNDIFIISGYYDDEYRPNSPWQDSTGTSVSEQFGDNCVKYWRYRSVTPLDHPTLPIKLENDFLTRFKEREDKATEYAKGISSWTPRLQHAALLVKHRRVTNDDDDDTPVSLYEAAREMYLNDNPLKLKN